MDLYTTLHERGYLYQYTDEDKIQSLLTQQDPFVFYMGIDPTADSLHIGHFFALMMFRYLQDAGHKGILVIGGATALVGDPTGKSDLRKMLTYEQVNHNLKEVESIALQFIKNDGDNPAIILNNADWINPYGYTDFLRDIGIHFNINVMLNSDAYAKRLESGGLTFLEMGYMLMQAYDFEYLHKEYGCVLQIGGSDQWGNIAAGASLHRKLNTNDESYTPIHGLTCPLLLTADGKKMGKTEQGTLWIARDKTTVWDFYQYFYNVHDESVEQLLKLFTTLSLNDIQALMAEDIRKAKRTMAYEITALVHGQEEAQKAQDTAVSLFDKSNMASDAPSYTLSRALIIQGVPLIDLLSDSNFIASKSEARRLIQQGGIAINGDKEHDLERVLQESDCIDDAIMIKKGKKHFLKIVLNDN